MVPVRRPAPLSPLGLAALIQLVADVGIAPVAAAPQGLPAVQPPPLSQGGPTVPPPVASSLPPTASMPPPVIGGLAANGTSPPLIPNKSPNGGILLPPVAFLQNPVSGLLPQEGLDGVWCE